jgi:hypothetical protein
MGIGTTLLGQSTRAANLGPLQPVADTLIGARFALEGYGQRVRAYYAAGLSVWRLADPFSFFYVQEVNSCGLIESEWRLRW